MRAETLADAEVIGFLNAHFTLAWENLYPELFGRADPNAAPLRYAPEQMKDMPDGAGGGNIRCYVCTPGGRIVHQMLGYWKAGRFLAELKFALNLPTADPVKLKAEQARHAAKVQAEWAAATERAGAGNDWRDPKLKFAAGCGVRVRGADELLGDLLADVGAVIDRRRDEVFTKGALGCGD
jgi:hypothetical protein